VPASQLAELPVPEGVTLVTYPDGPDRIRNAFLLAWATASLVRRHKPRVVHVHSTFAGAGVRPMLALMGVTAQVIYCPHGWAWDRAMSVSARKLTQAFERVMAHLCDKIVCISDHERQSAVEAGLAPRRLAVVLNGVAEKAPVPLGNVPAWPVGQKRLLFVGRFDRQKGVDVLCGALARMQGQAHGVLVGGSVLADGPSFTLPDNAESIGWVDPSRIEALLQSADVLVMPSRWEGFGLIAAEAMRAGVAVLASRVGGLPEVVVDGETGVLVEPDDVDALVEAVASRSVEQWHAMGAQGKVRFEKLFTMERVHHQLSEVYAFGASESHSLPCSLI
jgi:glycosyltransferase involved in cell wall biosynthesis